MKSNPTKFVIIHKEWELFGIFLRMRKIYNFLSESVTVFSVFRCPCVSFVFGLDGR